MRPPCGGQIWASQGGLSRNKVAVEESAAGSPPTDRDWADAPSPQTFVGRNRRPVRALIDLSETDTFPVPGATPGRSLIHAPSRESVGGKGQTLRASLARV
jgi:hypothetical protein